MNSATIEQYVIIDFVEDFSYIICEICGSATEVIQTKRWIKTLCKKCRG